MMMTDNFLEAKFWNGVESNIFWSEIGSGYGEPGGTPHDHQEFQWVPLGMPPVLKIIVDRII